MNSAWSHISSLLQQRLDPGHYKVWVAPLAGRRAEGEYVVHALNEFVAGFIRSRLFTAIQDAVTETLGEQLPVRITTEAFPGQRPGQAAAIGEPRPQESCPAPKPELITRNEAEDLPVPLVASSRAPETLYPPVPLAVSPAQAGQHALPLYYAEQPSRLTARSWRHSFDDFVVGPSNEMAFAASRGMCRESKWADILFLSSAPGLGKTHLMQAAGQQLCRACNRRVPRVEYLTAEEFTSRLVVAFKTNDTDRFKARYRDVDVLLLEDVHFLQGKEKMQDELLSTLKTLQDKGSKIIFSSSFMPRDMRGMSESLLSRLGSGFLATIEKPGRETRKRIFQEKAKFHQVLLPDEISDFLAESIESDVRQIESCLQNLALKAKILKTGITMQMAWEAVQQYASCEKKLDLERIVKYVCQGYGISLDQMNSKSRKQDLVVARNTVFYLARKHTSLSLQEIGNRFNRSHSTVIKGITTLEREISRESSLGRQMAGAIAIIERTGGIISPS